jgi:hypothetical protein
VAFVGIGLIREVAFVRIGLIREVAFVGNVLIKRGTTVYSNTKNEK